MIVRSLLCSGIRTLFRCDHNGNGIDDASDDADDDVGDVKDVNFVPILYLLPFLGRWAPCDKHWYYIRLETFDTIMKTVMIMSLIRRIAKFYIRNQENGIN